MKKIPNKFDIFLYFIVILTVMSSFVSIYTLYQQGGFELLIIDKVIQMVFVISMYAYYRKGNIIMLLFMAGMVILLALGIFMPMWDLGNAVQGRK